MRENEVGGRGDGSLFESSNRVQLSILSARVWRWVFDAPRRVKKSLECRSSTYVKTFGNFSEDVQLLAGPDKRKAEGARDHALILTMLRLSLRVSEVASLRASDIRWSHGRWIVKFKVKGGRERTLPLPDDVRAAIKEYLKLDESRRRNLHSDGNDAHLFQPITNYRTLEFDKPLSTRMVWNIVARWGDYCGIGKLSPHDLRRTAITRALDQGLSYRQVQMMSGHRDPKTVMRYDHHRENLDLNAVNHLSYDEKAENKSGGDDKSHLE